MDEDEQLRQSVDRQAKRMKRSEQDRPTLLSQTAFLGTLALMIVIPVVLGAYAGLWLDKFSRGYSVKWTIALIILGLIAGGFNAWRYIREH
jgi:ATP synthase protein I